MSWRKSYLFPFVFAIVAFAAGFLIGRREPVKTQTTEDAIAPPAISSSPLSSSTASHGDLNAETKSSVSAPNPPRPLERLQALVELNDVLQQKIPIPPLSTGDELNRDFVVFFGLSELEAQRLQEEISFVQRRLTELAADHAKVEALGGDTFTVSIPVFPTEGGVLHDQFTVSLRSILGDERYAYFTRLSPDGLDRITAFGVFGLSETVINISDLRNEQGQPFANSMTNFDQETGKMIQTVNTPLAFFKLQYPLIYQKLLETGALSQSDG